MLPIEPGDVVRGQYDGYRDEPGVARDSDTETFIALQAARSTTGAGPACRSTCAPASAWPRAQRIISIAFREPPEDDVPGRLGRRRAGPDHLTFDLADASRMSLSFYGKRPGPGMRLDKLSLQFSMHETGTSATCSRPTSG